MRCFLRGGGTPLPPDFTAEAAIKEATPRDVVVAAEVALIPDTERPLFLFVAPSSSCAPFLVEFHVNTVLSPFCANSFNILYNGAGNREEEDVSPPPTSSMTVVMEGAVCWLNEW